MKTLRQALSRMFTKSPRAERPAKPRLGVESLEPRQLMAAALTLNTAGVLTQGTTTIDTSVAQFGTDTAGDIFELKYNANFWEFTAGTKTGR